MATRTRKPKMTTSPSDVNWEDLAKKLQEALSSQIRENDDLVKQLTHANQNVLKMNVIISYLENKLWTLFSSNA